jgi:WhiB family redox-sensing transcriptional regulator
MTATLEQREVSTNSADDWRHDSACADAKNSDIFFPLGVDPDSEDEPPYPSPDAKAICDRCPVRVECLAYALRSQIPYGIYGGMSAYERSLMIKRKQRRHCPGCGSDDIMPIGRNQFCGACGISWDVDVPMDDDETD